MKYLTTKLPISVKSLQIFKIAGATLFSQIYNLLLIEIHMQFIQINTFTHIFIFLK